MNPRRLLATFIMSLLLVSIGYSQTAPPTTQDQTQAGTNSQTDTGKKTKKSRRSKTSDESSTTSTSGSSSQAMSSPTTGTSAANTTTAASSDKVWVNKDSKIYHEAGSRWYGKTKNGEYMTRAEAEREGYRPAKHGGSKKQE